MHKGENMSLSTELYYRVHNAIDAQRIVGNVSYSEEEYNELIHYTQKHVSDYELGDVGSLRGDDAIIFATLIEIAKRWKDLECDDNNDSGFWNFVYAELKIKNEQKLYKAFTELITRLGEKISVVDSGKKYYATIMLHSLSPTQSIFSFLDFAFNIYKKDLDYNYTENDKGICELATEGFRSVMKKLGNKDTDVSIGSSSYGIKIGLRCLALGNETRNDFFVLLDKAFYCINKLRHNMELPYDDYFTQLVREWWNKKSEKDDAPKGNRQESAATQQNFVVKFIQYDSNVYLRIPPIRFKYSDNPDLWLKIYSEDGRSIRSQKINIRTNEVTKTSVQQDIPLNEILDGPNIKLRIEIIDYGEDKFHKTIKVDKEFLLFGNEKELSNGILKPDNYFIYTRSIVNLNLPSSVSTVARNLYNIYPESGEMIIGNSKQVVFIDDYSLSYNKKAILMGEDKVCSWEYDGDECKVFSKKISLLIPRSISIKGLDLIVNGVKTIISDLEPISSEDELLMYDVTSLMPKGEYCECKLYSYDSETNLISEKIILIENLNVKFAQSIYYGDGKRQVSVNYNDNEHIEYLTWNIGDEQVLCNLLNGKLKVTIPQFKWRLDANEWHFESLCEMVWYEDYFHSGTTLEIESIINYSDLILYCVGDGKEETVNKNHLGKFEIGKFIYTNKNRKEMLFLFKSSQDSEPKKILETANTEYFYKKPLIVDNGKLRFIGDECYIGKRGSVFTISFDCIGRENVQIKSDRLDDGIISDISEGIYYVKISTELGGRFNRHTQVIWKDEFIFGDKDKLKLSNLVLKINPIYGMPKSDSWKWLKNGYYISRLIRKDNENEYSAEIYYLDGSEKTAVDGIYECNVQIESAKALRIFVENPLGESILLKRDLNGKILSPESQIGIEIYNYHYEVQNV